MNICTHRAIVLKKVLGHLSCVWKTLYVRRVVNKARQAPLTDPQFDLRTSKSKSHMRSRCTWKRKSGSNYSVVNLTIRFHAVIHPLRFESWIFPLPTFSRMKFLNRFQFFISVIAYNLNEIRCSYPFLTLRLQHGQSV